MEKVITATGKEFDTDYFVAPPDGMAFIRILNSDIVEVASVFSNPDEIRVLTCGDEKIEGYSFLAVSVDRDAYKVTLQR